MYSWFCPARQWSKRALCVFLARTQLSLFPLEWLWHCWNNRGSERGPTCTSRGRRGVGWIGWVVGGVRTCPSHGWSDSPCAGLHIWKRSCRREGGVKANKQEEQRCHIFTSSSQRLQGVIFETDCDETGVAVRLSSILNCILEKGTTTSSTSV